MKKEIVSDRYYNLEDENAKALTELVNKVANFGIGVNLAFVGDPKMKGDTLFKVKLLSDIDSEDLPVSGIWLCIPKNPP